MRGIPSRVIGRRPARSAIEAARNALSVIYCLLTSILCTAKASQDFLATVMPYFTLYRSNCSSVDSFYACWGRSKAGLIESP
jgi:hypothetical protein